MDNGFIDEDLPKEDIRMPGNSLPQAVQNTNVRELTPEKLNSIINDPTEHPEVRAGARRLKEKLSLPEENREEVKVETIIKKKQMKKLDKVQSPKEKISKPLFSESKVSSQYEFGELIENLQNELYTDEFTLVSGEDSIKMRSMKTEEYKFLAKQMEMFEMSKEENLTSSQIRQKEKILYNGLDTVLQRCIVNGYDVSDMNEFDWIYCLLYLRCISRDSTSLFNVKNTTIENGKEVSITKTVEVKIDELLKFLCDKKNLFIVDPMGIVNLTDDISLYLTLPTRGDICYINQRLTSDNESNYRSLVLAMCIKAFVKDGVANVLNQDQKVMLFDQIEYNTMKEIGRLYNSCYDSFFKVVNQFFHEECGECEALDVSDFIVLFYDF